mmetsp:Transcript_1023/g.4185  ORF Transcript_1023/g.4185 Transcript_1023/m.4185 type:complete len:240 (+) Transcript_1023:1368-2087(+)
MLKRPCSDSSSTCIVSVAARMGCRRRCGMSKQRTEVFSSKTTLSHHRSEVSSGQAALCRRRRPSDPPLPRLPLLALPPLPPPPAPTTATAPAAERLAPLRPPCRVGPSAPPSGASGPPREAWTRPPPRARAATSSAVARPMARRRAVIAGVDRWNEQPQPQRAARPQRRSSEVRCQQRRPPRAAQSSEAGAGGRDEQRAPQRAAQRGLPLTARVAPNIEGRNGPRRGRRGRARGIRASA